MITSVFRKSTPLNYFLVAILILFFFLIHQFQDSSGTKSGVFIIQKIGIILFLLGSVFATSFIAKKNTLTKDSTYLVFFYFLLLLFFPTVFDNIKLVFANLCVILAFRRIISLQTLRDSSQKIFDASMLIFIATLFYFWSILYIVLVFIAVFFHVGRDYRNWIVPFIALFTVGVIYTMGVLIFHVDIMQYIHSTGIVDLKLDYFTNNYQNGALSIFASVALFFLVSMFGSLSKKPLVLHTSFKKTIAFFFIGILVYVVSDHKSNDLLLFTFAPLSIMASSHIETAQVKLQQELVFWVFILCGLFTFFSQL
jgi:Family of unknown function (DUF6427)